MAKIEGASRADLFGVEWSQIVWPEPGHPLYDSRVEKPLTPEFIESIARHGYLHNAGGKHLGGGKVMLIWGRRRARALDAANKMRADCGWGPPLRLPFSIRNGDDKALAILKVTENENREDDSILDKARKVRELLDYGHPEDEVRRAFGVSRVQTMRDWLKLLDLDPATATALESGTLSEAAAMTMSALKPEERAVVIAEHQERVKTEAKPRPMSTADAREAVSKKKGKDRASAAKKKLLIAALEYARLETNNLSGVKQALSALGDAAEVYYRTQKKSRREKARA